MAERIAFKGKTQTEAKEIEPKEYLGLLNTRERRFIKRNPMQYKKLLEKIEKNRKAGKTKPIRTHARDAVILPSWIGLPFAVHNGKEFKEFVIDANMLGHRLGEYSYTTKRVQHSAPGIKATKGSKFLANK